jgi:outer membrane protein assembly factor BamB
MPDGRYREATSQTDNAHLISLDRRTGELLWETEVAD